METFSSKWAPCRRRPHPRTELPDDLALRVRVARLLDSLIVQPAAAAQTFADEDVRVDELRAWTFCGVGVLKRRPCTVHIIVRKRSGGR
ncbi:hypothetical protein SMICM304S_06686 [Streptomyces microflavus]